MLTCDPDRRLYHIAAAPGLLRCHQPIPAKGQVLIVAGHQVPGDGAKRINLSIAILRTPPAILMIDALMSFLCVYSRSHISVNIVLVKDASPAASPHLVVEGAVVF